ncbi:FtsW/RodA/SpoVE family cell cycle protein [Enterococcus mundtii]|uniref:FtsW/RodA/SpoVE family cell cycle protein n=1 Tax=Enterococcus mundtii TaxID=53346 RepID=UPI000DFB7DFE|nr:FtsW/RodA/SpoVE family cell cycle protein [Enterococcus mundtii]STD23188.1 cell cycle protein FtsW [Enterococcus mundtii]
MKFKFNEFNYALFLPIFLFYLLSVAVQYGAAVYDQIPVRGVVFKQIVFCLMSLGLLLVIQRVKTVVFLKYSPYFYGFSLVVMALLHRFYDPAMFQITGTKRWLRIGGFSFQPSELVKLTFILVIVYLTLIYEQNVKQRTVKSDLLYVGKILLVSVPTFLLMYMQKDFGTSLVFVICLGALFMIAGVHWKIMTTMTAILVILGAILIALVFTEYGHQILYRLNFKTYQLDRVRAWVDPFAYSQSIGYQQSQSLLSIGAGGFSGRSEAINPIYVPVRESDMVFTVIAETFGFLGSVSVLFLYFYLFYQIIYSAIETNNKGNVYFAIVFVFGLLFQVFENIGATIGLLPLTGIPLPFLSQGGTSLLVIGCGLGIILGFEKYE